MTILSIQSHVAYGHVGNAAAVFTLQRLGFDVWPVMTVQLSNHTGYPSWRGRAFEAEHIADVVQGLEELGTLSGCEAVLSGYLGRAEIGDSVLRAVDTAKRANIGALYVCDPVMGDHSTGLYVPDEIVTFMRERAMPRADIVTPNLFELEQLTGRRMGSLAEAVAAARSLHELGPEIVMVTSVRFPGPDEARVSVIAVTREASWRVSTPWIELAWSESGAGDAITALFLGHYLRSPAGPERVPDALARSAGAAYALIDTTRRAGTRELQLVAAQDSLVRPLQTFTAERLD
jgi:pyridoxine kinase